MSYEPEMIGFGHLHFVASSLVGRWSLYHHLVGTDVSLPVLVPIQVCRTDSVPYGTTFPMTIPSGIWMAPLHWLRLIAIYLAHPFGGFKDRLGSTLVRP